MKEAHKRLWLYGAAAAALGIIGVAAATVDRDADAMTLLSSIDVQLRLAYGMPAVDKEGRSLDARSKMIDEALASLDKVEHRTPGMAVTAEFRGFAHMLRAEYAAAADCYARARQCEDCGDEQFDVLAFNEARMRARSGDGAAALRVFAEHAGALDARFGHQRQIEEAAILREIDRRAEALECLAAVVADEAADPMAWLQAGLEFEELDADDRAAAAFEAAAEAEPIANYHLARLKLRSGDVDRAVDCLERAAQAVPAQVRRLIREEEDVWQALAGDARFEQLTKSDPAAPGR